MKRFLLIFSCVVVLLLSATSVKAQNASWEYLGKVTLVKTGSNDWNGIYSSGLLYGQFDGTKMTFKVYVSETNYSYEVKENYYYDEDKLEYEKKMDNMYDNWKGPRPSIPERYPQFAGPWYLNTSDVRK